MLLYPLDLTTARLQTKTPQAKNTKTSREQHERKADSYSSLYNALQTIYASGGIAGFYQGLAADTLATALSNFLYFYAYSALHKLLLRRKLALDKDRDIKLAQPFTGTEELIIGCIAGIISRAVTTPLSAITVRKQTAAKSRSKDEEEDKNLATVEDEEHEDSEYSADSSTAIAKDIYQTYGISGFWRGYGSACALVEFEVELLRSTGHAKLLAEPDCQPRYYFLPDRNAQKHTIAQTLQREANCIPNILHFCFCLCHR